MTMIYYHLDKSGLIDENFNNYKNSNFLLIGPKSLNGFSAGFVKAKLGCSLFNYISLELYYKIKHFFETRDTSQITIIINELYANNYLFSEVYIQRLLREIVFEYVRLNLFYDKPSRLSCIFLIDSEKELTIWKRYLSSNNYALYHFEKIDPKSYNININEVWHKADSRYLGVNFILRCWD